jgi:hypothetical protein
MQTISPRWLPSNFAIPVGQLNQIDLFRFQLRRSGKQHQIGKHFCG